MLENNRLVVSPRISARVNMMDVPLDVPFGADVMPG
jgi:hypothetical protein